MPATFPALIPEELVYSAVARYAARMRFPDVRAVLRAVFGQDTATAVVDLPTRLAAVVERLPWGHPYDIDQLVYGHTTFPYYRWFLPASRASRAEQVLHGGGRETVPALLGLRASTVPTPAFLRFCPQCYEADTGLFGSAAWKRSHQLPGVTVCPEHVSALCDSRYARLTRLDRQSFHALDEAAFPEGEVRTHRVEADGGVLRGIAEDSLWLLAHRGSAPASDLLPRYLAAAAAAGYATGTGYVRISELRAALQDHYGHAFLEQLGCRTASGTSDDDWLARLLRVSRSGAHPLQHILLSRFLGWPIGELLSASPSDLPAEPQPSPETSSRRRAKGTRLGTPGPEWEEQLRRLVADESVTLSRIAEILGVERLTVQRHAKRLGVWRDQWKTGGGAGIPRVQKKEQAQKQHRRAWLELCAANPGAGRSKIAALAPASYQWLFRNDREWLDAHMPERRFSRTGGARVDWNQRDAALAAAVEAEAAKILGSPDNPQRVTLAELSRRTGVAERLLGDRARLPRTSAMLTTLVEPQSAWNRRRLQWAADRFAEERRTPSWSRFLERAGIPYGSLAPEESAIASALLEELRTKFGTYGESQ